MRLAKNNLVFLVIIIFIASGLSAIWLNHDRSGDYSASTEGELSNVSLVKSQAYPAQVRPWLQRVQADPSLQTIREVKNKVLGLRGADREMGLAQVSLLLALESWERFLTSQNPRDRETAVKQFSRFSDLRPDLRPEAESLKNLIQ